MQPLPEAGLVGWLDDRAPFGDPLRELHVVLDAKWRLPELVGVERIPDLGDLGEFVVEREVAEVHDDGAEGLAALVVDACPV